MKQTIPALFLLGCIGSFSTAYSMLSPYNRSSSSLTSIVLHSSPPPSPTERDVLQPSLSSSYLLPPPPFFSHEYSSLLSTTSVETHSLSGSERAQCGETPYNSDVEYASAPVTPRIHVYRGSAAACTIDVYVEPPTPCNASPAIKSLKCGRFYHWLHLMRQKFSRS